MQIFWRFISNIYKHYNIQLENGKYLKRDIESANLYYRMSAEAGCEEAQQYLGKASKFEGQMEKTETMNNYKDKEEVEEKSGFFKRLFGRV